MVPGMCQCQPRYCLHWVFGWYFYGGVGGWVGGGWVSENGNNAISASMEVEVELSCVEAEAKGKKYGL